MQLETAFTHLLKYRGKNILPELITYAAQKCWEKIDRNSFARLPYSPETAGDDLVGVDDNLRMLVYATISPHEDSKKIARQFMERKAPRVSMQLNPQDPQEKWYPVRAFLDSLKNPKTVAHINRKANKDCNDIPPIQLDLFRFLAKHPEIKTSQDFINSVIVLCKEGVDFSKGDTFIGRFWGTAGRNQIGEVSQKILNLVKAAGIDITKSQPVINPLAGQFQPIASSPSTLATPSDEQQAKADMAEADTRLSNWKNRGEPTETAGRLPPVGKHPSLAHIATGPDAPAPLKHPSLKGLNNASLG